MIVKLLTDQHLEILSLKGGCTVSSTLVKMPHYWKSHVGAHMDIVEEALSEASCSVLILFSKDGLKFRNIYAYSAYLIG